MPEMRFTLSLTPMQTEEAARLTEQLVGSFPSGSVDAQVFRAGLVDVLASYPLWVGERVVRHLVITEEWLPSIASVRKRCEEDVGPARRAAEWDKAASTIKLAAPDRSRRLTLEELHARHGGPTWGITDVDRPARRVPTKEQALAKLRAEFGSEIIDAVPDALPRRDDMKPLR